MARRELLTECQRVSFHAAATDTIDRRRGDSNRLFVAPPVLL
jgi:hypothetical protein